MVKQQVIAALMVVGLSAGLMHAGTDPVNHQSENQPSKENIEFMGFLQSLTSRPGVSFEGDNLVLREVHHLTPAVAAAVAAALTGGLGVFMLTHSGENDSEGKFLGCAMGALGIVSAGFAYYFYDKHNNPAVLCMINTGGISVAGKSMIAWSDIGSCDVRERTIVTHNQYTAYTHQIEVLVVNGKFGNKLWEADGSIMPISPGELKVIITKYKALQG